MESFEKMGYIDEVSENSLNDKIGNVVMLLNKQKQLDFKKFMMKRK